MVLVPAIVFHLHVILAFLECLFLWCFYYTYRRILWLCFLISPLVYFPNMLSTPMFYTMKPKLSLFYVFVLYFLIFKLYRGVIKKVIFLYFKGPIQHEPSASNDSVVIFTRAWLIDLVQGVSLTLRQFSACGCLSRSIILLIYNSINPYTSHWDRDPKLGTDFLEEKV